MLVNWCFVCLLVDFVEFGWLACDRIITMEYNTIQVLLSTPRGGFSGPIIKILKKYAKIMDKQ